METRLLPEPPEYLERDSPLRGAVKILQVLLLARKLNPVQRLDGDWGDQTDISLKMLQNDLGVPMTGKLDQETCAAILAEYRIDFSALLVEDFLPPDTRIEYLYVDLPPFPTARAQPPLADVSCAVKQD